jgi:chemotaxis protein MotB
MKKALIISAFVVTFILGIVFSELILQGFNAIFGKDAFATRSGVRDELAKAQKEFDEKLKEAGRKYDQLSGEVTQKEANMNSLIKEIETKLNPDAVKSAILTTPTGETADKGKIFMDGGAGEGLLKPSTSDDPTVNAFAKAFNDKAKDILDVAKGILKEKIGQLNQELLRINEEVKDRNVQLIGKVKEVEGYQKKVDQMNKELKDRNRQLEARLKEVEQYKKELDEHKKYINDLEGIKSDLERTVGVLETKIEDGRLKVSFKGDILFPSGKHELRQEGKELLESVYKILKDSTQQNDIFVAGHTDNVPIRADARDKYESNWTLSTYRAIEVVKYLVEKGLLPKHLTAAGYGEFKPIADNVSAEGKAKNRRVELFLIPRIIKRRQDTDKK